MSRRNGLVPKKELLNVLILSDSCIRRAGAVHKVWEELSLNCGQEKACRNLVVCVCSIGKTRPMYNSTDEAETEKQLGPEGMNWREMKVGSKQTTVHKYPWLVHNPIRDRGGKTNRTDVNE